MSNLQNASYRSEISELSVLVTGIWNYMLGVELEKYWCSNVTGCASLHGCMLGDNMTCIINYTCHGE